MTDEYDDSPLTPNGDLDPTRIHIGSGNTTISEDEYDETYSENPLVRKMYGVAAHGYTRFHMPFITQVEGNLWHGGCESGLVLPDFFKHVVSLYPWEHYVDPQGGLQTSLKVIMYDSTEQGFHQVHALADWVNSCVDNGPTLVHCQAGLNRSSLVVASALIKRGMTPQSAVELMRHRRSPAVLCNPAFEAWILEGAGLFTEEA